MMSKLRASRERDERGFTLIELLVVILIIAILAAIAIPVFLRQREKAYGADVQSTLRNAATAAESWAAGQGGDYTGFAASPEFTDLRFPATQAVTVPTANPTGYCINITDSRLTGKDWGVGRFLSTIGKPEKVAC